MFKRTMLAKSLLLAFGGSAALYAAPSLAQNAPAADAAPAQLQRVEITGSAIKRIDAETAVPITVLKFDELKKQGVTTVEQALNLIAGNQSSTGTSQSVGSVTGGASFADMHGLGRNKTLVLLNGRRIANNALDGSAPDLNMIPFAALERVEVLRDGASALYGTDAIGGVINFITRKDMTGGTLTLGADTPQHAGGKSKNANVGFGVGDLTQDRYNVMGFLDFQKQQPIAATQRSFGSTGIVPSLGISKSSGTPDPANYSQGSNSANPSYPTCNAPYGYSSGTKCRYDYSSLVELIPDSQRFSGMLRGTAVLSGNTQLSAEYFLTQSIVKAAFAPNPYGALTVNPGTAFFPGNGITPAPTNFTIDPTQPINVQWRTGVLGPRTDKSVNTQQRFVLALDGSAAGWDYNVGGAYNQNYVTYDVTGGYSDISIITAGVADGTINPFGAQTAAGQAMLNSALVTGNVLKGKGVVYSLDAHASRELGDWLHAGRQAALAVGAEVRREAFSEMAGEVAAKVSSSTGVDADTNSVGSRNVYGTYAELNVPITKTLDVTGAVRYDKYSDFGSTINPKLSFRFQPIDLVLLRGSASTGFRAPSLYDLHSAQTFTYTSGTYNDPAAGCDTNGVATTPGYASTACATQFLLRQGGNTNLEPEKSKSYTLGLVLEPAKDLTVGFDLWWIRLTNQIGVLSESTIFGDPTKYASLFVRNSNGQLSYDGSQCPGTSCGYISDNLSNLGGVNTNGLDLSVSYRLRTSALGNFNFALNGTYVDKYEYQNEQGGEWNQNVGIYSGGAIFRWQHNATVQWTYGDYGLGLTNRYKSGYFDQNDTTQVAAGYQNHRVAAYSLWDVNGSWAITKSFTIAGGIRNLLDTDPPASNQLATFQTGYDPRYTDPTGRTFYLRGTYTF